MNLELLPNEILLDIFDYLTGFRLLRAFNNLNSRFNYLLYKQFRSYSFNLSTFSKLQFDTICQEYFPFISDRVITLTLSDNIITPGQINLFLSYITSLNQFIHLRSLSLLDIDSNQTLMKIVDELHYLSNLTHLKLKTCSFKNNQLDFQLIVDNIWSLPKLTHCHCDICVKEEKLFCLPNKVSTSLKNVTIYGTELKWNQIYPLFECTPRLEYLHIFITLLDDDNYQSPPIPTLISLNISIEVIELPEMISFLKNVPDLHRLNVSLSYTLINGYQWEQVIRTYLSNLKVFQLKMNNKFPTDPNIEERANELINSFRSSFWIDEHKWFVRCFTYGKTIHLQTLSKIFHHDKRQLPNSCQSTYPDDDDQKLCNTLQRIYRSVSFEEPIPSSIRLHNVRFLSVILPIPDEFWSIVPTFKTLSCLIISSHIDAYQSQLQTLLDHAPHLCYLHINQDESLPLQISLFKYSNASVRELYLENHSFSEEECITLTHSSLGVQCALLSIGVKNRESIIILVKNLINLRILYVHCEDDEYTKHSSLIENVSEFHHANETNKDDLIQWLTDNLSSTYLISKDPDSDNGIRLWIR